MGKYIIVLLSPKEPETPFIFEDTISHDEMVKMIKTLHNDVIVVSAGFCDINKQGYFKTFGRSVSLNIDSRDIDNIVLNLRILNKLF